MILYRITSDSRAVKQRTEWFATQADMQHRRKELRAEAARRPFDQIEFSSAKVNIPTDKAGLLEWLNKNCSRQEVQP